jgi:hypothetical protein
MCAEILVEGKEFAQDQRPALPETLATRAIPVYTGCCPECMGMQTGSALRSKSNKNELSAA